MRVPLRWLHEYCRPELDAFALAQRLAMTGTEVERVERHGVTALEHFVVGKVLAADRHPDADRLSVCLVDTGDGAPSQIVCGAPNVAAGQTVAVARPGAVMPDGSTLKVAKLRGQASNGMILAEDEVAIGTEHDGIMVLDDALAAGTPLERVLPIAEDVLVLEITPNRPDCLGLYGVAREVHAATGAALSEPPWAGDPAAGPEGAAEAIAVDVECPELCPRFTARLFEDVELGPSPPWLKARLMAAGQRPISNVVDITNYVMLLCGQPMHAFDADRIAGGRLTVRRAKAGERLTTLDGQARALNSEMVLIADGEGPTSIAGIMGGERSEVHAGTTRVLMEAATWHGANIHRTSLRLGLRSEASTRFEKQLQPEQALEAQAIASALMTEVCKARQVGGTIDVGGPGPAPRTLRLRDARVRGLLGVEVPRARCAEILTALEFRTADAPDGLDVDVPAFRRDDVTREADLVEEVARLGALEGLPATLPGTRSAAGVSYGAAGALTQRQRLRRRATDALTGAGMHEIVGWSFASLEQRARLRLADSASVRVRNPMSSEQAQLRTTLLGSLLDVAARNRARGAGALRLFEAGAVYLPGTRPQPDEPLHLAGLLAGPVREPTWRVPEPPAADLFAAKGALGCVLDAVGASWEVREAGEQREPYLHPGRDAQVLVEGQVVGWLGEVHPSVAAEWDLDGAIAVFEVNLDAVCEHARAPRYLDLTSFPEVREDLAVVVADGVPAARVLEVARRAGAPLLALVEVFDVYRDAERIGPGRVSLALRLHFRAPDRTLTDEEVAGRRKRIAAALAQELQGRVREA